MRLAACIALAGAPVAGAVLTEDRGLDPGARLLLLLAFAVALAILAALGLHRADGWRRREADARERALRQVREQQAASAEILGAISASPPDLQGVLDAVARNAVRVCDGLFAAVCRFDGELIHLVAHHNVSAAGLQALRQRFPRAPADEDSATGRAVRTGTVVHYPDVPGDPDAPAHSREIARAQGYRSLVVVPMLQGGRAIGTINVSRPEGGFTERQIRLLRTFADQAVIAVENVRLFEELQARNRELTGALEQQTATAEILRVISSSPDDTRPVFEAIVKSAVRLCDARTGGLYRIDHGTIDVMASANPDDDARQVHDAAYPRPLASLEAPMRRLVTSALPVHLVDVDADPEISDAFRERARRLGYRSAMLVALVGEGRVIGLLSVRRSGPGRAPQPFSDREIGLLQVFAEQAVVAIENVRLFQELRARNRELTEALEQQTATAEILRVISGSPMDVQPVFDAIARSSARLCEAFDAIVLRVDGDVLRLAAHHGPMPAGDVPLRRGTVGGRTVLEHRVIHLADLQAEVDEFPEGSALARERGHRTNLSVPLLRDGVAIGNIQVRRTEVRPFSDQHISLLQTFADQAVIAIENVRLFEELRARNRELAEALEQQTATAEILRVISSSPTDTQPVFDAIVASAIRLCEGRSGALYRIDDGTISVLASGNPDREARLAHEAAYPRPMADLEPPVRRIAEGASVHLVDVNAESGLSDAFRERARILGYRTAVVVPMIRDGRVLGAVAVARAGPGRTPRPFSDREVGLLEVFADQAVIAIENVRLFQELAARTRALARSVEELQALSEVGRAVSSTLDLPTVLATIVARAVQLSGTSGGVVYEYDEAAQEFHLRASHRTEDELLEVLRGTPIRLGEGASGQAALRRAPVEVADMLDDREYQVERVRTISTQLGYRSILGIPLLLEHRILGALTVWRREPGRFPAETVSLLQSFATQSALAIQNARLFREIEAKGRELEVASRHKSQFLANMSHELRTPLNAILGYTELLNDGIYGELPPKAADVMTRVDRSGKHLLGLINDVLDLSKIEAGQLELALADYSLREVVHTVVSQVEALAAEKGLALPVAVAPDLPAGRGDERRLVQVLLNLVGNAIKFTESGSVRIAADRDGDTFVVTVADTGPGIAEGDRERIFGEFQQADSSSTRRKGGTGLGLSIARRIIELHGGRLWVESVVGRGSTFRFRISVRVERQAART